MYSSEQILTSTNNIKKSQVHRSQVIGEKGIWELNITRKVSPPAYPKCDQTNIAKIITCVNGLTFSTFQNIPYLLQKGSEKPLESLAGKFLAPFNWICNFPPDFLFFFLSLLDSSPGSYIRDTVISPQYDIRDGSGRCGNIDKKLYKVNISMEVC